MLWHRLFILLSQVNPDSLSGGAGWVGAGLLGLVLGWLLLVHLPAKDKFQQAFTDTCNARIDAMIQQHLGEIRGQRKEFTDALNVVINHCDTENKELRELFLKDVESRIKDILILARREKENV